MTGCLPYRVRREDETKWDRTHRTSGCEGEYGFLRDAAHYKSDVKEYPRNHYASARVK